MSDSYIRLVVQGSPGDAQREAAARNIPSSLGTFSDSEAILLCDPDHHLNVAAWFCEPGGTLLHYSFDRKVDQ